MKHAKRLLCLVLCLALLLTLSPVASSAANITFLAVNDTIPLPLDSATMPFYANSLLYIPVSLFDVDALGIVPLYDSATRTLTIFNDVRSLAFDLDGGTMTNENGTIFAVQIISRNGQFFVPALYCAYHFGLGISFLTSLGGYAVVRFTTGSQVYDDELFIEKANNLIEYRAGQYLEAAKPSGGESTAPQPDEPDTPDDEPEEEDPKAPAVLYLAITGAAHMDDALRALENVNLQGAFFFTCEEIEENADLVLRLFGLGHTIGLIADGNENAANDALARITHTRAVCTLVQPDGQAPEYGVSFFAPAQPMSLAQALEAEQTSQLYVLDSSTVAVTVNRALSAGAQLPLLRETTRL